MFHIYLFRLALEVALGSSDFMAARGVFGWLEPRPRPRPAPAHIKQIDQTQVFTFNQAHSPLSKCDC